MEWEKQIYNYVHIFLREMLKGKQVALREIRKSDLPFFVKWMNDPEITQYLTVYLPMTMEEEEEWYENIGKKKNSVYFAITTSDDKLIGNIVLNKINEKNRCATLGIVIGDKNDWGKGYGREAIKLIVKYGFETLNLHRIELKYYDFNERAKKCYEKAGFKLEGMKRESHYINGKYCNEAIMSILKSEWNSEN